MRRHRAGGSLGAEALSVADAQARIADGAIVAWVRSVHGRWPRIFNVGLLFAGLGVGQGSIFLVQTWLLAKGRFEILSLFATHYSFAIFGIVLIDGGASPIIARHLARVSGGHEDKSDFWRLVSELMAFRLLVAVLVAIAA